MATPTHHHHHHHHELEPAPELQSWWFYTSAIPLDDPLCPLPPSSAPPSAAKHPPRPFSENDTRSLEEAYQTYLKESADPKLPKIKRHLSSTLAFLGKPTNRRNHSYNSEHGDKKEQAEEGKTRILGKNSGFEKDKEVTGSGMVIDLTRESPSKVMDSIQRLENRAGSRSPSPVLRRHMSPPGGRLSPIKGSPMQPSPISHATQTTQPSPFTRMPSKTVVQPATPTRPELHKRASSRSPEHAHKRRRPSFSSEVSVEGEHSRHDEDTDKEVVVGAQRLHKVAIPAFTLMPVYWDPLNDIAPVIRGTWFYRDTMLPVESEIANRLETGYIELRAWSEEWKAELDSALDVGWEGEGKIRWPLFERVSRPNSKSGGSASGSNAGMTSGKSDNAESLSGSMLSGNKKSFHATATPPVSSDVEAQAQPTRVASWAGQNDWVIFADRKTAFIGRDSMLSFGNKRPLQSIKKGRTVGTAVVRGFDAHQWVRLRPKESALVLSRTTEDLSKHQHSIPQMPDLSKMISNPQDQRLLLERDLARKSANITDLVLVIHGIGQKLSEKFESFHFTHAVNHFRRLINLELREASVKAALRSPDVGVMVLPVNWRSKVSFDDGTPAPDYVAEQNKFGLSDITPNSIPAVRDFVNDVMLDIPYYLSKQKKLILRAVVAEANRVYRLWCANNPNFIRDGGRVHVIAHSLGCAIAMDILSNQPDKLDSTPSIDLDFRGRRTSSGRVPRAMPPADERFDFDTFNLFTCGSPAGFFLLLHKGVLLPRKGRRKEGGEIVGDKLGGEAGMYGCLAVENIYNVLHACDPVGYRLNATVDVHYARGLKNAIVPTSQKSFFSSFRSALPYGSSTPANPPPPVNRLPSNVELEIHNFSREEIAEKRMYLLNDNGQIDYFLSAGGGALENQYLQMLGSHSSYWYSRDYARMVVLEVGRRAGRANTLQSMRAVKNRK